MTEVTIGDIIEYLSKYPKETIVHLDHDGWMAEENQDAQTIINERGLFDYFEECLVINN